MLNSRMRRAAAGIACLTCGLATACSDAGEGRGEERGRLKPSADTRIASATDSITVVFQMTGLLLIVPPTQILPKTHIVFPRVSKHAALLGFGADSSSLCVNFRGGICYVDLETWTVQPIGAGGAVTNINDIGLPSDVANVSRGAGGEYKVDIPGIQALIRRQVVFETGGIAGTPCALARWTYRPVNALGQPQTAQTLAIPNVLNWVVRYPADRPFKLTFVQGGGAPVDVPLEAVINDSIFVVLAHVPAVEVDSLPPATPGPASATPPARIEHFHDFYNLLRKSGQVASPPGTHRPLPQLPDTISPRLCPVRVTTLVTDTVTGREQVLTEGGGTKTYGCVVGSAES